MAATVARLDPVTVPTCSGLIPQRSYLSALPPLVDWPLPANCIYACDAMVPSEPVAKTLATAYNFYLRKGRGATPCVNTFKPSLSRSCLWYHRRRVDVDQPL